MGRRQGLKQAEKTQSLLMDIDPNVSWCGHEHAPPVFGTARAITGRV
jgi:hypothetical protein